MPNIFKIGEGVQEALNFELVGSLKRLGALTPTNINPIKARDKVCHH